MKTIEILRQIRETKKISRVDMANHLNLSYEAYKAIENDRVRLTLENFILICEKLSIDPKQILKSNDEILVVISNEEANVITKLSDQIKIIKDINNQTINIETNNGNININNKKE